MVKCAKRKKLALNKGALRVQLGGNLLRDLATSADQEGDTTRALPQPLLLDLLRSTLQNPLCVLKFCDLGTPNLRTCPYSRVTHVAVQGK